MRWLSVIGGTLLGAALCAFPVLSSGAERLHGLVLMVDAANGETVVRHEAFGSMPSMTMPFRLARGDARRLRAGERIEAAVDTTTEPWTLRDVRITAAGDSPARVLRNVTPIVVGDRVPQTPFIDQSGRPFTFASLHGKAAILSFIYTRCADPRMCPLISSKFSVLQRVLRGGPFHLVEVTLDPAFDRPAIFRRYGSLYGADPSMWTMLTGDPDKVLDFAARFGVTVFPDQRAGLIHPSRTVIVDPAGVVRQTIDQAGWSADDVVAAARAAADLSSNPISRFDLWLSSAASALCGNGTLGFSGLRDLAIVLAIFAGFGWLTYRVARGIFAGSSR